MSLDNPVALFCTATFAISGIATGMHYCGHICLGDALNLTQARSYCGDCTWKGGAKCCVVNDFELHAGRTIFHSLLATNRINQMWMPDVHHTHNMNSLHKARKCLWKKQMRQQFVLIKVLYMTGGESLGEDFCKLNQAVYETFVSENIESSLQNRKFLDACWINFKLKI